MTERVPENFTVQVDTASLACAGAGDGRAVVFLHAGVADRRMWAPQMADLSDSYRVVAYDRRGFGETTTADEPFSNIEDLRAVLDALNVARAVLVGCSQGGLVAIDFARTYPERVEALVLIASAVSGAPAPDDFPPVIEARLEALDAAEDEEDMALVNEMEAILWLDGPASAAGRVGGEARTLFLDMNGIALAHPELTQEIRPTPSYYRLAELETPALIMWGDLDFPHVQERSLSVAQTIPNARHVVISGTAHLPSLEAPAAVNEALRTFLEGLPGTN